jgi:hypothetical protein
VGTSYDRTEETPIQSALNPAVEGQVSAAGCVVSRQAPERLPQPPMRH